MIQLKGKFYEIATRPPILYGSKCWARKLTYLKIGVREMRILKWISGNMLIDRIRNNCICNKLEFTPIDNKMRETVEREKLKRPKRDPKRSQRMRLVASERLFCIFYKF